MFEHSKVIANHYSAKRDILFYLLFISKDMIMSSLNKAGKRNYINQNRVTRTHRVYG